MSWQKEVDELRRRQAMAREMGGEAKVRRQHEAGRLTVRERFDRLLDEGSFREIGSIAGFGEYNEAGELIRLSPGNLLYGQPDRRSPGGGQGRSGPGRGPRGDGCPPASGWSDGVWPPPVGA